MRNVWTKVVDKVKTHILRSINSFENRAVCEIMQKNTVQPGRLQMAIWRMHVACWIPTATNTHSEYVILMDFNNGCMDAPQCYIIRTLPSLL